jgi:hypothetical protein
LDDFPHFPSGDYRLEVIFYVFESLLNWQFLVPSQVTSEVALDLLGAVIDVVFKVVLLLLLNHKESLLHLGRKVFDKHLLLISLEKVVLFLQFGHILPDDHPSQVFLDHLGTEGLLKEWVMVDKRLLERLTEGTGVDLGRAVVLRIGKGVVEEVQICVFVSELLFGGIVLAVLLLDLIKRFALELV